MDLLLTIRNHCIALLHSIAKTLTVVENSWYSPFKKTKCIFLKTQSLFGKYPKMILHKQNYANAWLYEYLSYDELLGHGTWLQSFALVRFPRQGLPPLKGWGSVQVRCRKLVPLSHDLLQMLHGTSSLRPPSTIKMKWSAY